MRLSVIVELDCDTGFDPVSAKYVVEAPGGFLEKEDREKLVNAITGVIDFDDAVTQLAEKEREVVEAEAAKERAKWEAENGNAEQQQQQQQQQTEKQPEAPSSETSSEMAGSYHEERIMEARNDANSVLH